MKDERKKVLLYSGGMDSYIMSKLDNYDTLLYIDINGSYSKAEIANLPKEVKVIKCDLSAFEREDKIVPLRNLIFVELATNYGDRIYIGATAGDRVLDKSYKFAGMTSELLTFLYSKQHWTDERQITIEMPYKSTTKSEMIQLYLDNGGTLDELARESLSCYDPQGGEVCNYCKPCFRKYIALKKMGYDFEGHDIHGKMVLYLFENWKSFIDRKDEWAEICEVMECRKEDFTNVL